MNKSEGEVYDVLGQEIIKIKKELALHDSRTNELVEQDRINRYSIIRELLKLDVYDTIDLIIHNQKQIEGYRKIRRIIRQDKNYYNRERLLADTNIQYITDSILTCLEYLKIAVEIAVDRGMIHRDISRSLLDFKIRLADIIINENNVTNSLHNVQ